MPTLESQSAAATLETLPAGSDRWSPGATMLVVDLEGGIGVEFAEQVGAACVDARSLGKASELARYQQVVLFLSTRGAGLDSCVIDRLAELASEVPDLHLCVVSSFSVHFADRDLLAIEQAIAARFQHATSAQVTILRAGHILGRRSRLRGTICRLAVFHAMAPPRLRSCFVDVQELFAAIEDVLGRHPRRRGRVMTLLGANRALRDVLAEHMPRSHTAQLVAWLSQLLAWLGIGRLIGLAFFAAARVRPRLRRWQFDTLAPMSTAELLALYNPFNDRHVAVAGYNTGVVHFGWKRPGRTTVKTVGSGRLVRSRANSVVVDAGVTLKRTVEQLRRHGRELCVVPNYSYISMGTTFFVPVHGSACEVSTLGETIKKVWLYDPHIDRVVVLRREDPRFSDAMYNVSTGLLALRLELRSQAKRRFVVERSTLEAPTAADVWRLLADRDAANIELRKSRANAAQVDVRKYYPASAAADEALDVAQDSVGRVWDRLEENVLTSFAFHTLIRRWGFHVELFLDEQEFTVFWNAHRGLPLSKIQLRFVRADHLPHSPCGPRDCVSADLFMLRSKSAAFRDFIHEHLPHARFNPGKHSA